MLKKILIIISIILIITIISLSPLKAESKFYKGKKVFGGLFWECDCTITNKTDCKCMIINK